MEKPKAFIIEDDDELSLIFSEALKSNDYETEIIQDGELARQKLNEEVPYLVVLDMHLPHVNGLDLLEQIRTDSRLKSTRVIVGTADDAIVRNMKYKPDLTLLKPIDFYQLKSLSLRFHPQHQKG